MNSLPPQLHAGDRIAIVATSRMIFPEQMIRAREIFAGWGLIAEEAPHLFSKNGYLAGSDDERSADLQTMINRKDIKAIFCARGGYGATRIVDTITFDMLKSTPKWIVGFSDITAFHLALDSFSLPGVHGLMPVQFAYPAVEESLNSLYQLLFQHQLNYQLTIDQSKSKNGSCHASVIGGNLSLLTDSLGTSTEIQTAGKILLIEEIDEYLYKIDRMMNQLRRAGKFNNLTGIIIGNFSDMKDTEIPFGSSVSDLLNTYFTGLDIPVAVNAPFGHENMNLALPIGIPLQMQVKDDQLTLSLSSDL